VKVKRRVLAVLLGCALVGSGVALIWPRGPKEPEYQGERLSYWLGLPMQPVLISDVRGKAPNPETIVAVRKMGTNALPFLVEWVSYEPAKWQSATVLWLERRQLKLPLIADVLTRKKKRADAAGLGFASLGAEANEAVPALGEAISRHKGTAAAQRCLSALWFIHQSGGDISPVVPQLLALEVDRLKSVSGPSVVTSYTQIFDYKQDCVSGLRAALRHRDQEVREEALKQLYVYCAVGGGDPEVIRIGLKDQSKDVAEYAARLLAQLVQRQTETKSR